MNRRLTYGRCVECFHTVYEWICRSFGLLTAIGLWGIGAEAVYDEHPLGVYLLIVAVIVSFTELIHLVHFWLVLFIRNDRNPCLLFWNYLLWMDNWKKGILYLVLSFGCFGAPRQVWMALISGAMLVFSSLFYFIRTSCDRHKNTGGSEATHTTASYNRFEERIEELTDNFEETEPNDDEFSAGLPSFALADQEEILTV